MGSKRPFVVGLRTSRSTVVLFLAKPVVPIAGPWTLQAVVSEN